MSGTGDREPSEEPANREPEPQLIKPESFKQNDKSPTNDSVPFESKAQESSKVKITDFDDMLKQVGSWGRY